MKPIIVSPSLLSCDFANIEKEVGLVTEAGADWLHVDVMDGHFVNNITIGPAVVGSIKKVSKIPLDVHLMIEEPEKYVDEFIKAGSDILTIHVEAAKKTSELLTHIRKAGVKAGITMRPKTPWESILPFTEYVDLILVMTVEPGFGGQSFMQDQVEKIKKISEEIQREKLNVHIEVDGGINNETAKICRQAGADVFVAGSYVFKNNYKDAIQKLRNT